MTAGAPLLTVHVVILSGGYGARLWPASSPARPKQFLKLLGDRSLFQDTVSRCLGFAADLTVVTGEAHLNLIEDQLRALGAEATILVEPEGRDSGPALAAAAAWIEARDPSGVIAAFASDHRIDDAGALAAAVETAAMEARAGSIVTFGVRPSGPATAYGYIEPGPRRGASGAHAIQRFVEKPGLADAERFVAEGLLWNSGNFVARAAAMVEELGLHAPGLLAAVRAALAGAETQGPVVRLGDAFLTAPKISIDHALMEKTRRGAVVGVDFGWSDLGAWDAVWAAAVRGEDGNAVVGAVHLLDCRDCLVDAGEAPAVAVVGVQGIGVVVRPEGVLVCALDQAQKLKALTPALLRPPTLAAANLDETRCKLLQWLFGSALPVWWALGADHKRGGFHEALTTEARPVGGPRRVRVQARQIYVYATAGDLGWSGPWREAASHGLDFMLARYQLDSGLFRDWYDDDRRDGDDTASTYEQAFAMLALATAAQALPERRDALMVELSRLAQGLSERIDRHGGAREVDSRPYQSNPNMHLFEAALAWEAAGGGAEAERLADALAHLAMTRLIDQSTGRLHEFFNADWRRAPGRDGHVWEPGHQFEWASLLDRWSERRAEPETAVVVDRLFEAGRAGTDPARNAVVNLVDRPGDVRSAVARLWPQSERLKAAARLARRRSGRDGAALYEAEVQAAADCLDGYLATPVPGLWWDRLDARGRFLDEPARATSLYHMTAAIEELAATR